MGTETVGARPARFSLIARATVVRGLTILLPLLVAAACVGLPPAVTAPPPTAVVPLTDTVPRETAAPRELATAPSSSILSFGVVNGDALTAEDRERYQVWVDRLGQATGITLTLKTDFPTELALLQAMRDGQVALAHLTSWSYVYGHGRGWVEPGKMDLTYDGQEATAISFFARADSGLVPGALPDVLQQLAGRRPCYLRQNANLAWLPPLAEYILPAGLLARSGIQVGAPLLLDGKGASAVEIAVFRQECDFGAEDALPPTGFQNRLPGGLGGVSFEQFGRQMQVLCTTDRIQPSGLFAFSAALPAAQRETLNSALPAAGYPYPSPWKDYELRMAPFNQVLLEQYAQIVAASGVNLEDYIGPASRPQVVIATPASGSWTPAPSGTLVVDVDTRGARSFIPYAGVETALQRLVLPAIHAELARLDANGHYFPYLAAELPEMRNGLVRYVGEGEDRQLEVEFRLRPGLTWHDGQPLTADDLVFSWQLVTDPRWPSGHEGQAGTAAEVYVAEAIAPAPDRVIYHLMSQRQARQAAADGGRLGDARLYADLVRQNGPVVPVDILEVGRNVFPKHLLAGMSPVRAATGDFARRPVYAGAYRLVEGGEAEGQPVVLQAFGGFALGKPRIERVVFGAAYSNPLAGSGWQPPGVLAEALKVGAVHAQLGLGSLNIRQGADMAGYGTLAASGAGQVAWLNQEMWEVLDFNLDNPHLADPKVRQAIAYALDRQAMIAQVLYGHGDLMRSYLPATHPLYAGDATLPEYTHDPEKARTLLQEAGYDVSRTPVVHPTRGQLTLHLESMDVAPYPRPPIVTLIQQQLAEVGIQVEAQFHPWKDFEGPDCSGIRMGRRFDLGLAGWLGNGAPMPLVWVRLATLSASIPAPENGCGPDKSNFSAWRNARADALYEQLKDGRLALEQPETYRQLWAEHQRLWASDLPSLPLFTYQRPVVAAAKLDSVRPGPYALGGVEDTWNVFEWVLAD